MNPSALLCLLKPVLSYHYRLSVFLTRSQVAWPVSSYGMYFTSVYWDLLRKTLKLIQICKCININYDKCPCNILLIVIVWIKNWWQYEIRKILINRATKHKLANRFVALQTFTVYGQSQKEVFLEGCLRMSIPCILYAWFQKTYKNMFLAFASLKRNLCRVFLKKCSHACGLLAISYVNSCERMFCKTEIGIAFKRKSTQTCSWSERKAAYTWKVIKRVYF